MVITMWYYHIDYSSCQSSTSLYFLQVTIIFIMPTTFPVTQHNLNYAGIAVGVWVTVVMTYYFVNANRWFTRPVVTLEEDII